MTNNTNIQDIIRKVLLPALAGGAGTGAASAYLSSKNHNPQESKGERRRRILRNAMYGTALGGLAGGALPTGASMLAKPFFGDENPGSVGFGGRAIDGAIGTAAKHGLPLGVAAAGGMAAHHSINSTRTKALQEMFTRLRGEPIGAANPERKIMRSGDISGMLSHPSGAERVLSLYGDRFGHEHPNNMNALFHANEMIQATGHRGVPLSDMPRLMGHGLGAAARPYSGEIPGALEAEAKSGLINRYREYLQAKSNPISKLVALTARENIPALQGLRGSTGGRAAVRTAARLFGRGGARATGNALGAVEHFNPSVIAENYGRFFRPSMPSTIEAMPPAAKLMLLGGGVLGAEHLQKKLMGQ